MKHPLLFLVALIAVTACDSGVETRTAALPEAAGNAPATAPPPLAPAGPAGRIAPDATPDLQWAAAVVELDPLTRQGDAAVKLFGTAGGDPAMNGLYTHIAFFVSPAEGWRVFRIGDFLDYRVLAEAPGRVDLEVEESVMDPGDGAIGQRSRRLIVGWSPGANGAPPAAVTVTPAR